MGRFFQKEPKAGMPVSLQGLAVGLAKMARALERMRVENGSVAWSDGDIPTIMFGDDGAGSSPQFIESLKEMLKDAFGTIETPTHVLCKNAAGEVGWVALTQISPITAWRLDKTNHKFQVKTRAVKVLDAASESDWTDISNANGGILDEGVIPES